MRYFKYKLIFNVLLIIFLSAVLPVKAALLDLLQDGQHVLLMRHADAPGYGDPVGYQLGQCSTQRNLGSDGKRQAKLIGDWLVQQGIKEPKLFSSPWCRCLDTATLMHLGPLMIEPVLGSFFDDMSLEVQQTKQLATFIKKSLVEYPNKPIILVTHHVNIQAFTGKVVDVGDMVLVKVNKNGEHLGHTIYKSPRF
ncbi:histidine phosphatase family protein [Polynucleobacter kasalickyi]|uniref:Histidine phosphatase superfamily (Branch 1) n=1 Tax=Polynucleobacter kasalickyi TaxID=1938817 RepID=A0A1W2C8J7_9BURK|nr:histidine phosphatase family protein [Polynucleobacter kasalickyi]SMC81314.1 Histidine phosphatase superfamily (branch 1) [Polynucleobacter kasalickyi]